MNVGNIYCWYVPISAALPLTNNRTPPVRASAGLSNTAGQQVVCAPFAPSPFIVLLILMAGDGRSGPEGKARAARGQSQLAARNCAA
jgi:hypothetical protein